MNPQLFWLKDIAIIILASLFTYCLGKLIEYYSGEDYYNLITYVLVGILGAIPLIIILFFNGDFNNSFYLKYQIFTARYIFDCIVGVVLNPVWREILE